MAFFFDRLGVVEATHTDKARDPESDAIEAGAQNVEALDAEEIPEGSIGTRFLAEVKDLSTVSAWLAKAGWKLSASEIRFVAKNPVELGDADKAQVTLMVTRIMRLDVAPKPADAADAVAIAICHLWRGAAQNRLAAAVAAQS
jgi:transcriptional/translational regulatory protein YebC/TACO1